MREQVSGLSRARPAQTTFSYHALSRVPGQATAQGILPVSQKVDDELYECAARTRERARRMKFDSRESRGARSRVYATLPIGTLGTSGSARGSPRKSPAPQVLIVLIPIGSTKPGRSA